MLCLPPLQSCASRLRARQACTPHGTPWDCIAVSLAQAVTVALLALHSACAPVSGCIAAAARLRGAFILANPRPPNQRSGASPVSQSQHMQATVRSQDEPLIAVQSVPRLRGENILLWHGQDLEMGPLRLLINQEPYACLTAAAPGTHSRQVVQRGANARG
ncbi:hypothetical protein CC86DRAFT_387545 [Ophiobolus disseminans]|uniref:Uncharacterized protein n=1 Tax=Ophiobolus disseminans TaxID=1469910 RepID=A0A6A6ZG00_9PLEO|nr:hypothetical protein CC86DRAFT_387545 [Ophiobolus disseminans]